MIYEWDTKYRVPDKTENVGGYASYVNENNKENLVVITKEAWEKISNNQRKNKRKPNGTDKE